MLCAEPVRMLRRVTHMTPVPEAPVRDHRPLTHPSRLKQGSDGSRQRRREHAWRSVHSFFDVGRIWWSAVLIVAVSFCFATSGYAARFPFSSDDVALQNIAQAVLGGQPFHPTTGSATWVLKVPVYLLVDLFIPNGTANLVVCVILLNLPLLGGVLFLGRRLVERYAPGDRRVMLGAMVVVWCFFAARIPENGVLMGPNARNGEIGVALIIGYWAVSALHLLTTRASGWRPQVVRRLVAIALALALLVLDDTIWLGVLVPTLLLVVAVAWLRSACSASTALTAAATVALGVGGGTASLALLQHLGLIVAQNFSSVLIAPEGLIPGLGGAFGALTRNFNADVWGRSVGIALLPPAVQFVFAATCIVLAFLAAVRRRVGHDFFRVFLVLGIVVDLALDVATGNASVDGNFRYAMIAAVFVVLLAIVGVADLVIGEVSQRLRRSALIAGVLCALLGAALNLRVTLESAIGHLPDPQARTHEVIRIVEDHGLTVGLGQYWDASVTSYFAGRRIDVGPVLCSPDGIGHFPFLVNAGDVFLRARRMFVITNTMRGCTSAVIQKTYGRPAERIPLAGDQDEVWIYDHPVG